MTLGSLTAPFRIGRKPRYIVRHCILRNVSLVLTLVFTWLAIATYAQAADEKTSKVVVVFVDLSASVQDFTVYREGWKKILDHLNTGDRIVMGSITSETLTRFRPFVDETMPQFNWLSDNKLRFEKKTKETKEKLRKSLDEALKGAKSPKTDILNSLLLAEKVFRPEKRRAVLVLMSDMLEDSDRYNFERIKLNDSFARQVIEEKRKSKQLPDLGGATVYVAGASAKSAGKALAIQQFWMEFCKAANAVLAKENYGSALINFNE
jgi:hypothetical protein